MGQHFLTDERVAHRHVEFAGVTREDIVLEIGPGLGVLTAPLMERAAKVVAIERDHRLARGLLALGGNLEIVEGDAVRVPFPRFTKAVSNLPYQISSPITFRLLDLEFDRAALMFQEEFANRLVAKPGEEAYSRLSVKAYFRARAEIVEQVPRSAFWPPPKVDSAIVLLHPRPAPFAVRNRKTFEAVVDVTFQHRRKTIENGLQLSWRQFAGSAEAWDARLAGAPHLRRRPEQLSPEEFGELADALTP